MNTDEPVTPPNAVRLLDDYLRRHQLSYIQFARLLSTTRGSVYSRMHSTDVQVRTLWTYCQTLKYNFFRDIAATLPPFDDDRPTEREQRLQQQVAELQQAVSDLNIELNAYKNILKKV
jgi:hypothetical protein